MPTPVVREAVPEDAEALLELYRQLSSTPELLSVPETAKIIAVMTAQPWLHLLVATLDDVVAGTTTIAIVPSIPHFGRPWAQVENVVVHENYRRQGVGHALMVRCEEITREAGGYKMQLISGSSRKGAHAFYETDGFDSSFVGFRKYF